MKRMNPCLIKSLTVRTLTAAFLVLLCISCEDLMSILSDPRGKLIDTWNVNETSPGIKSDDEVYRVVIAEHPTDSSRILISNFYNVGENTMAEAILADMSLNLPVQTLPGGFTVSGSGDIQTDWNSINWSYSVDDGSGIPETFTAVYTRLE